jgi:ABC-2 type transport system ATP-binding protein
MITVSHLTKSYGRRTVVDDLSFELAAGRITGFVGPNGAGKSTTMRMMVGLARPDAGEVTYRGASYADLRDPARTIGVVLDARAMHPGRSARNHLRAMAAISSLPEPESTRCCTSWASTPPPTSEWAASRWGCVSASPSPVHCSVTRRC